MLLGGVNIVSLLIGLIIGGLIVYAVYLFIDMLTFPEPLKTLVKIIVAVLALVWLARLMGIGI